MAESKISAVEDPDIAEVLTMSMGIGRLKRFLLGQPLSNQMREGEKISKVKALAVLSSDALSSTAYAT